MDRIPVDDEESTADEGGRAATEGSTDSVEAAAQTPSSSWEPGGDTTGAEGSSRRPGEDPNEPATEASTSARPERRPDVNALYPSKKDGGRAAGPETTLSRMDRGLSTQIGSVKRDGHGRLLSSEQRARAGRLRKWHRRSQQRDSRERSLRYGLDEVQRMGTSVGVPDSIQLMASKLYREAVRADLLPGRSIESVASACLYAAARVASAPRTFDEVAQVARVSRRRIVTAYQAVRDELDVVTVPIDPIELLPRVASKLDLGQPVQRLAREIIQTAREHEGQDRSIIGGASPTSIVAAAVYAAVQLADPESAPTQQEIADVADVHPASIRNNYRDLLKAYDTYSTD